MLTKTPASSVIAAWPEEAREAAHIVIDARGEPDELTESELIWHDAAPWKRVVAQRAFWRHDFPAPHTDSVESFLDYKVPVERFADLAAFDGSVMVERTSGEVSARCHDEQANFLALNLMDEIVRGRRTSDEARSYYAKEFLDAKRKAATPYMEGLRFQPSRSAPDPDRQVLSDDDLRRAKSDGSAAG